MLKAEPLLFFLDFRLNTLPIKKKEREREREREREEEKMQLVTI